MPNSETGEEREAVIHPTVKRVRDRSRAVGTTPNSETGGGREALSTPNSEAGDGREALSTPNSETGDMGGWVLFNIQQ